MSVVFESSFETTGCEFYHIADKCFLCGEKLLELPLIMWSGTAGQIWMHPECAAKFSAALLRDVVEVCEGKEVANAVYRQFKE